MTVVEKFSDLCLIILGKLSIYVCDSFKKLFIFCQSYWLCEVFSRDLRDVPCHLQQCLPSLNDYALCIHWVWTARLMDNQATCLYSLRGRDLINYKSIEKTMDQLEIDPLLIAYLISVFYLPMV